MMQPIRIYNLLYTILLISTGAFIIIGYELGNRPLIVLNNILGVMLIFAGILESIAVVFNNDQFYETAFVFTTIAVSSLTFTLAVYAGYGLVPWTRVIVYIYILASNAYMLPYLLTTRYVSNALKDTEKEQKERGGGG